MEIDVRYINQLEVIISLFTVIDGKIKILLIKRDEEPFKNYWYLPSNLLMTSETALECAEDTILEFTNFENVFFKQCNVFSKIDRLPNDRIIANSLIGIVNYINIMHYKKREYDYEWFDINSIPKTVYDHSLIIEDSVINLSNYIKNDELVNLFFDDFFTLPELQSVYETAYNKKLDRRNFRKSMLAKNKIIDALVKAKSNNGRPPKLYKFNNEISENLLDIEKDIM